MAKEAKVELKRLSSSQSRHAHGLYEISIVIPKSRVRRSADNRTYIIAEVDERVDQQLYLDGISRRARLKLEIRIDLPKEKALKVKQQRALAAFKKNSPILL